ncbi:MAG: hypothetical protein AB7V00_04105 [Bacilli bacterium]
MNKKVLKYLGKGFLVIFGGLTSTILVYFLYYLLFISLTAIFFKGDMSLFPMEKFSRYFALSLCSIFLFLSTLKWSKFLKAIIMIGPLTVLFIFIILGIYLKPFIGLGINIFISLCLIYIFIRIKVPWYFYLSIIVSMVASFLFAWPFN